ncbi:MAG: peptidoglycan bridge formation glycyltransferase FemA/FemB family protein [Paludibacter sp.]|nr:peptidoglycan bridge formation glycyltransferase FemA/FemB family protein [Paludibacter sp.]
MTVYSSFSDIDKTQWKKLILQSPTATFFQTPECYEFYSSLSFIKPFIFGISENDRLVGVLSGYIASNGNTLKQFFSRRAIVCGGVLLDINISEEALKQLLIAARNSLKRKSIYFEIRNYINYSNYKATFESAGFSYIPHLNFHIHTPDVETALKNLSTTRRREIKLSVKSGVVWQETKNKEDIQSYYAILQELYTSKVKTPLFPLDFFEKLIIHNNGKLFVIRLNNKIIGGSVCVVLANRTVYEWFVCGLDGQFKNVYPSTIATWAAIEYTALNDYSCFDMMGAGKPDSGYGVREFKSKFGGKLVEDGRFLYLSNPFLFKIGKAAVSIMRYNFKKSKNTSQNKGKTSFFTVENQIKQINLDEWSDFVSGHPNGNIFQTPEMYQVYHKTPKFSPVILVAKDEKNRIVGCLMSVIHQEYTGLIGKFTARSIIMGGPLAENNNSEILDFLLKNYNKQVRSKVIYSQFRNLFDMSNYTQPFTKNGYRLEEHLDVLIDLKRTKTDLEGQLHKERKRNIAKAEKEGLTFRVLTDEKNIKNVILLLKKTYNRVKVPFSFDKLFFNSYFILDNNVKFFGAFWGDKMIAGQVRLCYKDTVYAWYAGSDSEYFRKKPNDFLLWNVILWSKDNNYSIFDFGGAGKPNVPYGVRDYKSKFGGELVNYGRYQLEHKRLLMIVGRFAFKLYKIRKK